MRRHAGLSVRIPGTLHGYLKQFSLKFYLPGVILLYQAVRIRSAAAFGTMQAIQGIPPGRNDRCPGYPNNDLNKCILEGGLGFNPISEAYQEKQIGMMADQIAEQRIL